MLDGIPILNLTAGTLLGIFILMMFLGRIVTRRELEEQIKEKNTWHAAYEVERAARIESDTHKKELLELAKTTNSIVVAVFSSEHAKQVGGNYVAPIPPQK